jgi:hypothetical protein
MFQNYDFSYDNLYYTFLFSLELSKVSKLILSYYSMVHINYLWPLLHKPKLLPYVAKEFLSPYMVLLHVDMVIIHI